jgi:hypothetical protein
MNGKFIPCLIEETGLCYWKVCVLLVPVMSVRRSTGCKSYVFECHRNTEKEEEEKKEKKEKNKERKEKERKQRKEEEEDGEGGWERVKGGIIPLVSKV